MTLSAKHTANGKSDISNQMMKDKTLNHLFFFIGFLALVFYYGLIHPLVPFDTDDWMNMTISRPLYPSLHCWNPTKVFPERLEPAVAMIAAFALSLMVSKIRCFSSLYFIYVLYIVLLALDLCIFILGGHLILFAIFATILIVFDAGSTTILIFCSFQYL